MLARLCISARNVKHNSHQLQQQIPTNQLIKEENRLQEPLPLCWCHLLGIIPVGNTYAPGFQTLKTNLSVRRKNRATPTPCFFRDELGSL